MNTQELDVDAILEQIDAGYIRMNPHPTADLRILNYTQHAQYDWHWTPETMQCRGLIVDAPRGSGGFGYDPLFYDEELGKTFAEIAPEEKNARSHRGKAFRALAERLVSASPFSGHP